MPTLRCWRGTPPEQWMSSSRCAALLPQLGLANEDLGVKPAAYQAAYQPVRPTEGMSAPPRTGHARGFCSASTPTVDGMEEVRVSSPLSSTIAALLKSPLGKAVWKTQARVCRSTPVVGPDRRGPYS